LDENAGLSTGARQRNLQNFGKAKAIPTRSVGPVSQRTGALHRHGSSQARQASDVAGTFWGAGQADSRIMAHPRHGAQAKARMRAPLQRVAGRKCQKGSDGISVRRV